MVTCSVPPAVASMVPLLVSVPTQPKLQSLVRASVLVHQVQTVIPDNALPLDCVIDVGQGRATHKPLDQGQVVGVARRVAGGQGHRTPAQQRDDAHLHRRILEKGAAASIYRDIASVDNLTAFYKKIDAQTGGQGVSTGKLQIGEGRGCVQSDRAGAVGDTNACGGAVGNSRWAPV